MCIRDSHVAMGLTQLLLTVIIMVINQKFFISGYKALWHLSLIHIWCPIPTA